MIIEKTQVSIISEFYSGLSQILNGLHKPIFDRKMSDVQLLQYMKRSNLL